MVFGGVNRELKFYTALIQRLGSTPAVCRRNL